MEKKLALDFDLIGNTLIGLRPMVETKIGKEEVENLLGVLYKEYTHYKNCKIIDTNKNDKVTIICYGKTEVLKRDDALTLYKRCVAGTEGHEKERYANVLVDLMNGNKIAWDGEEDEIPNGFHVCKYCYSLAKGNDTDRLCDDCKEAFGHDSFDEL